MYLVREPSNAYDSNAIKVISETGLHIGYVPREDAAYLADVLDTGCKQKLEIKKILSGKHAHMPVIVGGLYAADTLAEGVYSDADAPPVPSLPLIPKFTQLASDDNEAGGEGGGGCAACLIILTALLIGLVLLFISC